MAKLAVVLAVEKILADHWTRCPIPEANGNGSTPAGGTAFLQVQYPYSTSERITFGAPGANTHREEGAFRILLHVERGSGTLTGLQWADELETLFLSKHFDGVQTFTPSSANSDDSNENGQYYTFAVAVPYRFDFIG